MEKHTVVAVDIQRFPSGRHFASYLGLTPREYSSGVRRRLVAFQNAETRTCACCWSTDSVARRTRCNARCSRQASANDNRNKPRLRSAYHGQGEQTHPRHRSTTAFAIESAGLRDAARVPSAPRGLVYTGGVSFDDGPVL